MSKSKGAVLTVSVLQEKGYDPLVYRFFCLQSHYRKSLVFSWENLDNAKTAYDKLTSRIAALLNEKDAGAADAAKVDELKAGFAAAMDEDLNTSNGMTVLYDILKSDASAATKLAAIEDIDKVLCVGLIAAAKKQNEKNSGADIPAEVMALVEERQAARKAKDFAKADEIRDKITALGYEVKETRQGTTVTKL